MADLAKASASATQPPTSSPRPMSSVIQVSAAAADRFTAMPCQRLGSAWQKACRVRSGRQMKRSVTEKTTPDVSIETKPAPGAVAPTPTAAAALSPAPPTNCSVLGFHLSAVLFQ